MEFRQEDITDPQMIALAESLLEMPLGAKALLEVLRLQIITAKTPPTIDPRTKQPLYPPLPEYTRYVTSINLKGNEVSASVLQELSQYMDVLRREDKRLEIRAALNRIDRNSDGGIDEEEFKGVLKLLTTSTPTKKEIRAFMQQHTLSTDSTQNAVNLENVLLAKCAISPSRHSACPPWEALVQERHAILGISRMEPAKTLDSHDVPPPKSRPSFTSSDCGMTTENGNPFLHSNSASDVSPLSSPSSQAPVAPIDMANATNKPLSGSLVNMLQTQAETKTPELKSMMSSSQQQPTSTKPPPIPILPLASVMQYPVSPSPRSARSSIDDEAHRNPPAVREGAPHSIISAPSSPHDSDLSDSMSVISSTFGGSMPQRMIGDQEPINVPERKPLAPPIIASITLDSPRWQSEHFSAGEEETPHSGSHCSVREEVDELSSRDADDDACSAYSHKGPKPLVTSVSSGQEVSDIKSVSTPSRVEAGIYGNETQKEVTTTRSSEYSSTAQEEKRSLPGSVASSSRFDDLSSLVYRGVDEAERSTLFADNAESPLDQPEEDDDIEERVDSLVFDVMRGGKERYVVKLVHSQFRNGLSVQEFPAELPFRNLLALFLPDNGLADLSSLGSIPCAGFHIKDKKKTNTKINTGKSLFDSDLMPDHKDLWVSIACDELQILQDASSQNSGQSQRDEDEWDTRDEDGDDDKPKRPLTREQQRQKDEMRSRAIGYRSRGKAIPSPPKVKTSVYCFGPPQPPPTKAKKKKTAHVDPKLVREQQRRASELSAPKHAPVDKTLMHQEQNRKSRVNFQVAMTVGEKLQLARDMTQRRPTATIGLSARSRSILAKADSRKRAGTVTSEIAQESTAELEVNSKRAPSLHGSSPAKAAMIFRIDSVSTPRSPKGVLAFRVDPYPVDRSEEPNSPKNSKEAGFLHDLAVSDFLNHAEEEFSTALTALTVLLSMSEKDQDDRKKMADYRQSLDAMDILNEHESHELFKKAQGYPDHGLQAQCTEWFTKLGVVKKCMRQLLEKLEDHAPGSGVIRAYCRYIRSNELRGIITTMLNSQEDALSPEDNTDWGVKQSDVLSDPEQVAVTPIRTDTRSETSHDKDLTSNSVTSRLFGETSSIIYDKDNSTPGTLHETSSGVQNTHDFSTDNDFTFLESSERVLSQNNGGSEDLATANTDDDVSSTLENTAISEAVLFASATDITMDIQMNETFNGNTDDSPRKEDSVEGIDDGNVTHTMESQQVYMQDGEARLVEEHGRVANFGEAEKEVKDWSGETAESQSDNYDWLATSTELDAGNYEADTVKHDTAAASEDEAEGAVDLENSEKHEDYDWSNAALAEPSTEEEVQDSAEVHNDGTYVNEETYQSGEIEGDYANHTAHECGGVEEGTDNFSGTAAEDTERDTQYELGGGVDADDEEAETFGDWEKGFDPNSNHYFWFNHSTGESSWTPPDGWPYEVDEPFSAEHKEAAEAGEDQQDGEYQEGFEAQEADAESEEYEGDNVEQQYYEESTTEAQYYPQGDETQTYDDSEAQYYDERDALDENQEYEEGETEDQNHYEAAVEEQQREESTADGHWYNETDVDFATKQNHEEQGIEQTGEESPRRSEVSDFEFDDSDLPGF
ncbi:unnamed protein product [Phytophthora fragariaefolia]|uniref:Unnamed protein product n=1 Tax=Phytophthora fragariaefolia TaxID=1490495 RepID=A0A9W6TPV2_9STRA|nr:unnamed protein product [Phytophthora fragariaefolia]